MAIEAGRVLNQRYRLIRPVGQGSQASVWVAEHLALQTHVAVKLIDQELAKKETARERFRREATAAAQLRSAHVVQILDHGIDGDQPFIVMELLDGEDLFERLAHRGRLSLRETSKIVTQVARALSRAHAAGIVHRDLKPENVFLCPNEDDEVVKVLDFGVAKVKDAAKVTMQKTGVGTLIGTPHYMSPEQVKGIVEVDYRTDLWALGVIAFQCVTGELPYDSEGVGDLLIKISIGEPPTPSKVYPGVPTPFDVWFAKACDRDPARRYQSAREMALALVAVVAAVDGVAPRAPTVRPPAASLPALADRSLPAPPRVPGIAGPAPAPIDWEEIDPFDDDEDEAPTRMKSPEHGTSRPPMATTPGIAPPRPGTSGAPPAHREPAAPHPHPTPPRATPSGTMPRVTPPRVTPPVPAAARQATPPSAPAPAPPPPPPRATPAVRVVALENHDSHDIVDFDETIPATEAMSAQVALAMRAHDAPAASPESARVPSPPPSRSPAPPPPPSRSSVATPPPPPSRPVVELAPRAVIAPVMMTAPAAYVPQPAPEPPPPSHPSPPRPPSPPSSRNFAAPPSAPVVRATTAPVEIAHDIHAPLTEPPLEFDGAGKRRRMVRILVAALVLAAVGITYTVVGSQLDGGSSVSGPPSVVPTTTAAPPPPPPPPPVTQTATAVDPGKVTHPGKVAPSGTVPHKGPLRPWPKKAPGDGTIVVPDPAPDDSVPAAP